MTWEPHALDFEEPDTLPIDIGTVVAVITITTILGGIVVNRLGHPFVESILYVAYFTITITGILYALYSTVSIHLISRSY